MTTLTVTTPFTLAVPLIAAPDYDEDEHPRDSHGRFASKESGLADRIGRCYELSAKYQTEHGGTLVHGSIQGGGNPRIDHAWVKNDDGTVHDAVLDKTFTAEVHAALFQAEVTREYTRDEALDQMVESGQYGPWHASPDEYPSWDPRSQDADFVRDQERISHSIDVGLELGLDTETKEDFINGVTGKYNADREAEHIAIVDELLASPDIKYDAELVFMGGLPGSGKTFLLNSDVGKEEIGDLTGYVTVNPDEVKQLMNERGMIPDYDESLGLTAGEAATLVHEESSHVAGLVASAAAARGANMVIDISLRDAAQYDRKTREMLDEDGPRYRTTLVFVDVPPAVAMERVVSRYNEGERRYYPLDAIKSQMDPQDPSTSLNRRAFEDARERADRWLYFKGQRDGPTRLVERGERSPSRTAVTAADWDEEDHPRGAGGKFGTKNDEPSATPVPATGKQLTSLMRDGLRGMRGTHASAAKAEVVRNIAQKMGSEHDAALIDAKHLAAAQNPASLLVLDDKDDGSGGTWRVVRDAEPLSKQDARDVKAGTMIVGGDPAFLNQLRESAVSDLIAGWATSSNGGPPALALQTAAAQELGLETFLDADDLGMGERATKRADAILAEKGDALRAFVRAQHDATQELFAKAGITHVEVHRGMNFDGSFRPSWARHRESGDVVHSRKDDVQMRPLSSWSYSMDDATGFGGTRLSTVVPVRDIVATPRTGVGCLSEAELVLMNRDREYTFAEEEDW